MDSEVSIKVGCAAAESISMAAMGDPTGLGLLRERLGAGESMNVGCTQAERAKRRALILSSLLKP